MVRFCSNAHVNLRKTDYSLSLLLRSTVGHLHNHPRLPSNPSPAALWPRHELLRVRAVHSPPSHNSEDRGELATSDAGATRVGVGAMVVRVDAAVPKRLAVHFREHLTRTARGGEHTTVERDLDRRKDL